MYTSILDAYLKYKFYNAEKFIKCINIKNINIKNIIPRFTYFEFLVNKKSPPLKKFLLMKL